jgi:hypothetical protein
VVPAGGGAFLREALPIVVTALGPPTRHARALAT